MRLACVCALAVVLAGCHSCDPAPTTPAPVEVTPEEEDLPTPEEVCAQWSEEHVGWCEPMGAGAWHEENEGEAVECGESNIPESGFAGQRRIGYTATDGSHAEEAWVPYDDCQSQYSTGVRAHYDFDGDGHDEIVLEISESYVDGGDTHLVLRRFSGAEIGDYEPANDATRTLQEARDVDGDGRLDLVSHGPHERGPFETDCCSNAYSGGPSTLWHALPDGTFSRSDEVALAHLRETCGDANTPIVDQGALQAIYECYGAEVLDDLAKPVTCARLRGLSVDEVRARITAEVAAHPCVETDESCCEEEALIVGQLVEVAERVDTSVTF